MIDTAQIIAVGDEVLWGETVNTNAAWMANFLMDFGIRPTSHVVVPDQPRAIGGAVVRALNCVDLIVVMGGLGPTADDRTLDAISAALKRPWGLDEGVRARVSQSHSRTPGWEESVNRQARVLAGALVWPNARGQAPGQLLDLGHGVVVLLPGPPGEMQGIAQGALSDWLLKHTNGRLHRDTYSVFDLGESQIARHLWPLLEGEHPKTGIYAQAGRIDIRVQTDDTDAGVVLRERSRAWIRKQLPVPVYVLGQTSREAYLIKWLARHHRSLASMESITGGLFVSSLIAVPGASSAVLGGVVAYTDDMKRHHGVSAEIIEKFGAVSEECAQAMAQAVVEEHGASIGVATTGFAGPDGGTEKDPVGTFYVAAVGDGQTAVKRCYASLDRPAVRQVAVQTALNAVWQLLKLPTLLDTIDTD